jgi:hypothetical protein
MNTFLNKTMGLWRKPITPLCVEKAVVEPGLSSIKTWGRKKTEFPVQPEVPLMSLPYELLIQIMESIHVLYRKMTLSSFRL